MFRIKSFQCVLLERRPLRLGETPVAGEIAVGAYVTEAAPFKLMPDGCGLSGAMFQDQPAVTLQVIGSCTHYFPYGGEPVSTRRESDPRLVLQRCVFQCLVAVRHIGWITGDDVESAVRQGGEPCTFEKFDLAQLEGRSIHARGSECGC